MISAGGDQQCGALGLGVLEHGTAEINCGTGAFAIALSVRSVIKTPVIYRIRSSGTVITL